MPTAEKWRAKWLQWIALLVALAILLIWAGAAHGAWDIGTIDATGDAGTWCSIVRDADDHLHVAYLRADIGLLLMASRVGDAWQPPDTVDSSGQAYRFCDVAKTANDTLPVVSAHSGLTLWYAGRETPRQWTAGIVVSSPDNVGTWLALHNAPDDGASLSFRNETQGSLMLAVRDDLGGWATPETVDTGPGRGVQADHALRPGVGYALCEIDDVTRTLRFADTVIRGRTWQNDAVLSSADDVGSWLVLEEAPYKGASLSFRNATKGSLMLTTRDSLGVWAAPSTVDAGPGRGAEAGHAYRPGAGYALCEIDDVHRTLRFGDPTIRGRTWQLGTFYSAGDVGRFVSMAWSPQGLLCGIFYGFNNDLGHGSLHYTYAQTYNMHGIVRTVVDSISTSASANVYGDVFIDTGAGWHVTYFNPLEHALCYAAGDSGVVTAVGDEIAPFAARQMELQQNFPNPFNPTTTFRYAVPGSGPVRLAIYDVAGRRVRLLVNEAKLAGPHQAVWDGRDEFGVPVASGVYFAQLVAAGEVLTSKAVLLR